MTGRSLLRAARRAPRAATLRALAVSLLALPLGATRALAQVGYPPAESPYRDIEFRQEMTTFAGWFNAAEDPAGVAPQSGPMFGARYDLLLGGPAYLTARLGAIASERTVIDPARPQNDRVVGTEQRPLGFAEVGITTALTGQKTWHGFVPLAYLGVGVVSNFEGEDLGGYEFGTSFAFSYGAGVKYVPSGRLAYRADVGGQLYRVQYPDRYFTPGLDGTSVLPVDAARSNWLNNLAITIGVSYQYRR